MTITYVSKNFIGAITLPISYAKGLKSTGKNFSFFKMVFESSISSMLLNLPHKATITFKDSLNFLMAPLRALPATYGFEEDAAKQYFPHGYNHPRNYHRQLDHLPNIEHYDPDNKKPADRIKLLEWYEKHYATPFCLKKELEIYCEMDVLVLMKACVKFRATMMEITGIDPFATALTIAKYAFVVFRSNFLKENMLVNVAEEGYRKNEKQSETALKFFRLYESINGVTIQDATWADGEFRVPNTRYRVDGVVGLN